MERRPEIRVDSSMTDPKGEVTQLARRWSEGDEDAFDRLVELVYDDLRRIAHSHLRLGGDRGTINTTALVHEAYLKLAGVEEGIWEGRSQFFAFCSKAMRRILIDYSRERKAEKRGGNRVRVPLTPESAVADEKITEILALDQALQALEAKDQRMAQIAECRYFGGLSVQETGEALSISPRTVEREWAKARGYLFHLLRTDGPGDGAEPENEPG
jgi:RNA polymerase sigma factor (TIGR02999 family)